jgi:uncharacterized protein (TIGR02271 family)
LASADRSDVRVPLVEEQLSVAKREVETDRVRVRTVVDAEEVLVEETLSTGHVDITRIATDREVAAAPAPYEDGDALVISVVEERLVVKKRLFVVEELRVTRSSLDEAVSIPVALRRMRAVIERDDPDQLATGRD